MDSQDAIAARLRLTFDLFEAGVSIMRARLRRLHPEETAERIEERLLTWLHTRPGAEFGDAPGRLREIQHEADL